MISKWWVFHIYVNVYRRVELGKLLGDVGDIPT